MQGRRPPAAQSLAALASAERAEPVPLHPARVLPSASDGRDGGHSHLCEFGRRRRPASGLAHVDASNHGSPRAVARRVLRFHDARSRPPARAYGRDARSRREASAIPPCWRAMRSVPRERFLSAEMAEFAYEDAPLPIEQGQTISPAVHRRLDDRGPRAPARRPRARDRHRLGLRGGGAGPHRARGLHHRAPRASWPRRRPAAWRSSGFHNVFVLHGDGTLGWPEHAPFDAIVVAAGGPRSPRALARAARPGRAARHPGGRGQVAAAPACASADARTAVSSTRTWATSASCPSSAPRAGRRSRWPRRRGARSRPATDRAPRARGRRADR